MLKLKTEVLEFRGFEQKTSAKGNTYYNLFVERNVGESHTFYVQNLPEVVPSLQRGEKVAVVVEYNKFKELVVLDVVKADGKH